MKQIQFSTMEITANAEIIQVNSYLISKAIRSLVTLEQFRDEVKVVRKNENGEESVSYSNYGKQEINKDICEKVLPFIEELVKGFEE